jgi:ABC-2 type transport system ATP-binding protein
MRLSYGIDNNSKIGILSKGQKTRVGLLVALAYHPDLLLLDEPSSGLDPLVRHELLNVLTAVRGEQRTVIFSSHVLSEIDKVCSHVAMLRKGRVAFCDNVSTLRSTYFRATIAPALSRETALSLAGVLDWEELGPQCTIVFRSPSEPLVESIAGLGCAISDCVPLSLEDLFMVYSRMEHLPQ